MELYDLARISEQLVLGTFKEIFDLPALRSMNAEKKNFPGIDLADDTKRVAIQVTASTDLDKVKTTLDTFLRHRLNAKYDRLIVYVLTDRQTTYSQAALDGIQANRFSFSAQDDIIDYQGFLSKASNSSPAKVLKALEAIRVFNRGGIASGVSAEDFDPPEGNEQLFLNLIDIYLPRTLFVADLVPEARPKSKFSARKSVRAFAETLSLKLPSGFEVHGNQLVTFFEIHEEPHPFKGIVDPGTVTTMAPREFYEVDENYERVFKSLLRLLLQQKLHRHRVRWMQEDALFAFLPREDGDLVREEKWLGEKEATRTVFERKLNRNDASKDFVLKHLAFGVDFVRDGSAWYVAITPDWYFSFGQDYRRSQFADEHLGWLKRHEGNGQVATHFRFFVAWLSALDKDDLFTSRDMTPSISFGEALTLDGHPTLDEEQWRPLADQSVDDEETFQTARLFQ